MKKSRFIVLFFFYVLIISALEPTISSFVPEVVDSALKITDELFVLFLFLFTLNKKLSWDDKKTCFFLIAYFIIGMSGGLINGAPLNVLIQGFLLSIKGPLLLIAFCRVSIDESDIRAFWRHFKGFLMIVMLFCVIDLASGLALKTALNLRIVYRGGSYILTSFFKQPATLADFAFLGAFYFIKFRRNKFFAIVLTVFGILTFNVKEIFGGLLGGFLNFKNSTYSRIFKPTNIIVGLAAVSLMFYGYMKILPDHFNNYFVNTDGVARVMLYRTSIQIGQDDFPVGEGFGRYGGFISSEYYSPVYVKYGLSRVYGLESKNDRTGENFIEDTFWPMILGESGVLGLIVYIIILRRLFKPAFKRSDDPYIDNLFAFTRCMFIYSVISSIASPYFAAAPSYVWLFGIGGMIIAFARTKSKKQQQAIAKQTAFGIV